MRSLVFDIGNSQIVAGAFIDQKLESILRISSEEGWIEWVDTFITDHLETGPCSGMVASVDPAVASQLHSLAEKLSLTLLTLDHKSRTIELAVERPEEVGADRIANAYGAAKLFPGENTIILDIGTALVFDAVRADRTFLGGAIAPGLEMGARALHGFTSLLPAVQAVRPSSPISPSTVGNICSGLYHGLLGTIERLTTLMTEEMGGAKVIATGGLFGELGARPEEHNDILPQQLREDLATVVDVIEPEITLCGINEALHEHHVRS